MKQKKMLSLTLSQIRQLYCQELPELTAMAQQSLDDTDFKNHLQEFLTPYISGGNKAGEQIRLLISYNGKTVHELSNEQDMQIQTLSLLRRFLTEVLIRGTFLEGLTLAIHFALYFVQLRIAKVKPFQESTSDQHLGPRKSVGEEIRSVFAYPVR